MLATGACAGRYSATSLSPEPERTTCSSIERAGEGSLSGKEHTQAPTMERIQSKEHPGRIDNRPMGEAHSLVVGA